MNYLAHIYLSSGYPMQQIGNFVADSIKGKSYLSYPIDMQEGILLHRAIDDFSDHHPIFRQSTKRLHKDYGHYAGVLVDMYYDHFLAKNWSDYSTIVLAEYTLDFYDLLRHHLDLLPPRVSQFFQVMTQQNWLMMYANLQSLEVIISQMNRNKRVHRDISGAVDHLRIDYILFYEEFRLFFDELISFCKDYRQQLIK